ncbi:hypothetical protein DPX16_13882 [Anabarilius grahami]|uniref:Uncharacterized protein n=1 Tax=Anabarilius grahami TaxID=495550 RepID=A0A3N0XV99_ANAGA|nr:hypothetical protein DPX16_13882 [Anabarilius grahami]
MIPQSSCPETTSSLLHSPDILAMSLFCQFSILGVLRCEPRLCNMATAEVNGIVGYKEGLSNAASCSSRMAAYVIKVSEFTEAPAFFSSMDTVEKENLRAANQNAVVNRKCPAGLDEPPPLPPPSPDPILASLLQHAISQ